jgi:hypothetical protein
MADRLPYRLAAMTASGIFWADRAASVSASPTDRGGTGAANKRGRRRRLALRGHPTSVVPTVTASNYEPTISFG